MKIITNDCVYVQKNDIAFLNQTDILMPGSIFMKVFGKGITIINNVNRFSFVKFKDKGEIEFFKSLDWIIDYDTLKGLTEEQIIELGESVSQQRNNIANDYNSMSNEERINNSDMFLECELLDYKMYSLRDFLWFKRGQLNYTLPKGIDYPYINHKQEGNEVRRILRRLKRK